jgi:type I restriction enzyme, S subunit
MKVNPECRPALRFTEFKADWQFLLLDSIAHRGSGHTPSKSHPGYYDGEIDWISLADSKSLDAGYISETKSRISELGLANSSAVLHPPGTVILSRDAGVGKSAVMKHSMAVSQHFIVWRPISGLSSSWFIYYWLQIQKREFERIAVGSTIKTIGLPYFKKLRLNAPTLPEQEKIADFLTAVDKRIGQLTRKKALLEDYKKGVMQQLFSQAIRFKDDHGNDFPDWEEKTLGEIASFHRGSPLTKADLDESGTFECIHYGELFTLYNEVIRQVISRTNIGGGSQSHTGDILMPSSDVTPDGLATASSLATTGVILGGDINVIRPVKGFNSEFLSYLINFQKKAIIRLVTGTTVKHVYNRDIATIAVALPPSPDEQTKIADFLSAIDRRIETVATQITETQTFKRGLLQQMFV